MSLAETSSFGERMWPGFRWLVFLFFATLLIFDRVVYILLALLMVSLAFASMYIYRSRWDVEIRVLSMVLLANLLLAVPNLVLARDGMLSLENPLRMLFMIPLILAVKRCGLQARFICDGLAIGMLGASTIVSWQYFIQEVDRPGTHYNPLLFSEIAMSGFAILLAACLVSRDRVSLLVSQNHVPLLYLISLIASLYSVVLSGSRGTLVAVGPIIIFLLYWWWRAGTLKYFLTSRRAFLLPVILLFLGAGLVSNGHFIDRTRLAVSQISDYFEKGDASTPVGLRLELWRASLLAAREHPLLGIGYRDRNVFIEEKIVIGDLKPEVSNQRHAHNDYFATLQSRGVPGLMLQLLIYAVPLIIFIRRLQVARGEQLFVALGGTMMIIGYMTFSLTEVPMHNGLPLVFFIITTSLLIGMLKYPEDTSSVDHSR